jgi:hypothetical protein
VFFPIAVVYQSWGYHIFRKRLSMPRVDAGAGRQGSSSTSSATPTPAESP